MKKDFVDELIDALVALKNSKKTVSLSVPPAPHEIFDTIVNVAKKHDFTADEARDLLSFRGASAEEIKVIEELEKEEKDD